MSIESDPEEDNWPAVLTYPFLWPSINRQFYPCFNSFHQCLSVCLNTVVLLINETRLCAIGVNCFTRFHSGR